MYIDGLIEKFEEGIILERSMADIFDTCARLTKDPELKAEFEDMRGNEQMHEVLTEDIIEILKSYIED